MSKKGFSLLEIVIALGLFTLFGLGIYSGTQMVFRVVNNSRFRIVETGILNEQVEIIRNLPFTQVGIINGSPSGVLARTVTTTRNGVEYTITRTIRNIDDPYDGTIGGNPNDTAPADYKLVDIEVICSRCAQSVPLSIVTQVGPKYLEGDPNNGALFVQVFDANAEPVQGATIDILATTTSTTVDITDTTDNEGWLRIVDLPSGIGAYHITSTKPGYTLDGTRESTAILPNPVKPPASVVAQDVTSISFSIDKVSQIDLSTIDSICSEVGGVAVDLLGTKLIGIDPETFLIDKNITTDGSGVYTFADLVWDAYGLRPLGYDLIGSIPPLPMSIAPDVTQPISLILGADTADSLLVNVLDSITGLPISDASVTVTSTGYTESSVTGFGFVRQTDWSGGAGQPIMNDDTRYWSDDGKVEVGDPAGDVLLTTLGQSYVSDGQLESSIFDLGTSANLVNITWSPLAQPPETGSTSLRFQIATSNTSTPVGWDYLGPDGTAGSYYDQTTPSIHATHNGDQFLRYRAYLTTASSTFTPTLSDWSVSYTTSCTPPGQAYFGGLSNQEYSVEVIKSGYQSHVESVTIDGDVALTVDLVTE